jgi:starch synthase
MRVIVSCVSKFHAFSLVEQLEKNGVKVIFFTTYSSISDRFISNFVKRKDKEIINESTFKTNIIIALLLKILRNRPQLVNNIFDYWVSREIKQIKGDVFIGWSGMSLKSIKVANSLGLFTILERGSAHIQVQNDLLREAYKFLNIDFNIDESTISKELKEYDLVNKVSIPSNFCFKSFRNKGVVADKLFVNPYGVSHYFFPKEKSTVTPTRILFLGKLSIQKGVHFLFESLSDFLLRELDFEFVFIGAMEKEIALLLGDDIYKNHRVKFFGHVDHYILNDLICECDVAIVPSIQDGYALVVPQILKVGLPVIVSENVGSEQIVVNGVNGWVIRPELEKIREMLKWCINNTNELRNMRRLIVMTDYSHDLSWDDYGKRYVDFLERSVNEY